MDQGRRYAPCLAFSCIQEAGDLTARQIAGGQMVLIGGFTAREAARDGPDTVRLARPAASDAT